MKPPPQRPSAPFTVRRPQQVRGFQLKRLRALHPRTAVAVQIQTSARIEELAAAQQIDFGLAEHPFSRTGIAVEPFSHAPMRLAVPAGHPLARRGIATPRDLTDQPLVTLSTTSACRQRLDLDCQRAGIAPRIAVEVKYATLVARFVALGLGVGLVDPFTALSEGSPEIETVAFEPAIPFEVGLLHPSQRPLSRAAREFLALLRRHRGRVLGPQLHLAARENATPVSENEPSATQAVLRGEKAGAPAVANAGRKPRG